MDSMRQNKYLKIKWLRIFKINGKYQMKCPRSLEDTKQNKYKKQKRGI